MRAVLERAARAAALIAWLGCHSDGVVGELTPCEPACEADETCDPMLGRCVEPQCMGAECEAPDECDDCRGDAACMAMFCRSCVTNADCTFEEPFCIGNVCVEEGER